MCWLKLNKSCIPLGMLLLVFFLGSCKAKVDPNKSAPLARAYSKYLYPEDVSKMLPEGSSPADSIEFTKAYVDQWINNQLLLHHAEFNLDAKTFDFTQLIEDYRASLLIHEYRQQMLLNKVDTTVEPAQIQAYFTKNLSQFKLPTPVVKALYIRIQKDNSKITEIRNLLKSTRETAFEQMVNLCYQYADRFDFFEDKWVSLNLIFQKIPGSPEDQESFLRSGAVLEITDSEYKHFLQIHDYKLSEETAPLEYVEDRIRDLVLNERRMNYLKELEQSVYQKAAEKNSFEIFDEN